MRGFEIGLEPMEREVVEGEAEKGPQTLVHVALPPVRPGQRVAQLGAPVLGVEVRQGAGPDEVALYAAHETPLEEALAREAGVDLLQESLRRGDVLVRWRAPILHDLRMGEDRE